MKEAKDSNHEAGRRFAPTPGSACNHIVEIVTARCVLTGCNFTTCLSTLTTEQLRRMHNYYGDIPPHYTEITRKNTPILGDDLIWSPRRRGWSRVDEKAGSAWPWMYVSDFEADIKCARRCWCPPGYSLTTLPDQRFVMMAPNSPDKRNIE